MEKHKCRLCGHEELDISLTIPHAPRNIQKLLSKQELRHDYSIEIQVHTCQRCGFVQIPPILDNEYYDDYLMGTTHSEQMQTYQKNQAIDFIKRFDLTGKLVIEIGCGDGNFMNHLKQAGATVFGVEPSKRFRDIALNNGHYVIDGYITDNRHLESGPFDAFVTRQVLEHVPNINSFLSGIRKNLHNEAYGLIEVPSLEKAIQDYRYYDFFTDHVNYFSFDTLRLALTLNGFRVLEICKSMFDEYNLAFVKTTTPPNLGNIQHTSTTLGKELNQLIINKHKEGKKVAVWGAGGKGISILASAKIIDLDLLVDSDPFKQEMYTPVSHILVQKPTKENLRDIDTIIITAMAYRYEIENNLRLHYDFKGLIFILNHHIEPSHKLNHKNIS